MATATTFAPALRSLNYRLEQFVSACSEPGVTPTRLLTLLSDSQTAAALLSGYQPYREPIAAPVVKEHVTFDGVTYQYDSPEAPQPPGPEASKGNVDTFQRYYCACKECGLAILTETDCSYACFDCGRIGKGIDGMAWFYQREASARAVGPFQTEQEAMNAANGRPCCGGGTYHFDGCPEEAPQPPPPAPKAIVIPQAPPIAGMTPLGVSPKVAKATKVEPKAETTDVRRFDWRSAVSILGKVMEKRASAPILSAVHVMRDGSMEATDLKTFCHLHNVATTNAPTCIPFASLAPLDGMLYLRGDHGEQCISNGATVSAIDPQDWPLMPSGDWSDVATMDAGALVSVLRPVQSAITAEDARYFMAGALLGACATPWAVSTDGHRLAACGDTAIEATRVLIPRDVVGHLIAMKLGGPVRLQSVCQSTIEYANGKALEPVLSHYRITDSVGNWIAWKAIEGTFPAFEKIIACNHPEAFRVDVADLLELCKRAKTFSKDSKGGCMTIADDPDHSEVCFEVSSAALGSATYRAAADIVRSEGIGPIVLNWRYLADAANAAKMAGATSVSVYLRPEMEKDKTGDNQMVMRSPGLVSIIMPMRLT